MDPGDAPMNADVRVDAAILNAAARSDAETEADRTLESDAALILPYLEAVATSGTEVSLLALAIDRFALIEHLHGAEAAEVIARHLLSSFQSALLVTGPAPVRIALRPVHRAGRGRCRGRRDIGAQRGERVRAQVVVRARPGHGECRARATLSR